MSEEKFIKGLFWNSPHEKAPEWVKGGIAINKEKFTEWLKDQPTNDKGYIKIDLLKGKEEGDLYMKVNDYGVKKEEKEEVSNLPF